MSWAPCRKGAKKTVNLVPRNFWTSCKLPLTPCHNELCKSKVFLNQRLQLNSCRTIVELIFLQVPFSRRISIFQSASISSAPLLRLPACSPAHEMYESGGGGGGV